MPSSLFGPKTVQTNNPATGIINRLAAAKQAMTTLRMMNNPQAGFNDLLNQNPEIKNLIQSGADPRAAFYARANQMGIDPETVLAPLREMMRGTAH